MIVLLGLTLLSFLIRFILLDRYPAPPSSDFGNYLTQLHIIQGHDVEGLGLRYPPMFFIFLAPAEWLVGGMLATKILAAAVASSSCIPLFLIARRWSDLPSAAAVTVLFTFSQAISEMTAWGGDPNFLAITFFIFVLYFLDRAFSKEKNQRFDALMAGVFSGLVVLTHHLTLVVLIATLVLFFLFCFVRASRLDKRKAVHILKWMAAVGLPISLPAAPIYYRMQSNLSSSLGSYGPPSWESLIGPGGFHYILGAHWIAWLVVFVLGAIMIIQSLRQRDWSTKTKLLVASSLAPVFLGLLVVGDAPGRVFMFLPIPLVIGFGMLIVSLRRWAGDVSSRLSLSRQLKRVVLALFVADVVIISASGIQWMSDSVDWYHPIERGDVTALNWVKDHTAADSVLATSGKMLAGHKEGDRLGWWIEGYSERRAVMAGSEMFRLFQDELVSTRDMNRFFAGTHVLENGFLQVSDAYPMSFRGNPEIAARNAKIYEPLVFFNDATNFLSYHPNGSSAVLVNETLEGALRSQYEIDSQQSSLTSSVSLDTSSYEVTREVALANGERSVSVSFHVLPEGSTVLSQLTVNVWCSHGGIFKDVTYGDVTRLTVSNPWDPDVSMTIDSNITDGDLASVTYLEHHPIWQLPVLEYVFSSAGSIDFTLTFTIPSAYRDAGASLAEYNGYDILSKYGVDYLFESTSMMLEIERFMKDPSHFEVVYSNSSVVIFRVI